VVVKRSPAAEKTDLCLVLAAATLKVVATEIGDGDQTAQVADVDAVRIADLEQSFSQELRRAVRYLTVTLHLAKTQTTIPERTRTFNCSNCIFSRAFALRSATQVVRMPCVCVCGNFFSDQPLSPSWFDRSR